MTFSITCRAAGQGTYTAIFDRITSIFAVQLVIQLVTTSATPARSRRRVLGVDPLLLRPAPPACGLQYLTPRNTPTRKKFSHDHLRISIVAGLVLFAAPPRRLPGRFRLTRPTAGCSGTIHRRSAEEPCSTPCRFPIRTAGRFFTDASCDMSRGETSPPPRSIRSTTAHVICVARFPASQGDEAVTYISWQWSLEPSPSGLAPHRGPQAQNRTSPSESR